MTADEEQALRDRASSLQRRVTKLDLDVAYGATAIKEATARAEAAEKRLVDLSRRAGVVEQYAKHPSTCPKGTGAGFYVPPDDAVCECGIDRLLGLLRPSECAKPA